MQTLCTLISTMWFTLREFTRWPYRGYWIWRTTILLRLLVSDWPYLITSPSNEYTLSSALTTLKEKEAQVTLLIQTEPGINWWATVQSVYLCYYNHRTMQAWRSGGCVWTNAGTHTHCPHFWLGLHCPTSKKVPTIYTVLACNCSTYMNSNAHEVILFACILHAIFHHLLFPRSESAPPVTECLHSPRRLVYESQPTGGGFMEVIRKILGPGTFQRVSSDRPASQAECYKFLSSEIKRLKQNHILSQKKAKEKIVQK